MKFSLTENRVAPLASFLEAGLAVANQADGFVLIPEGSEGFAQGVTIPVYLYDEANQT
jgi:hypothetical protein